MPAPAHVSEQNRVCSECAWTVCPASSRVCSGCAPGVQRTEPAACATRPRQARARVVGSCAEAGRTTYPARVHACAPTSELRVCSGCAPGVLRVCSEQSPRPAKDASGDVSGRKKTQYHRAWYADMERAARREPWLTKVKPQVAAEHACRHGAVAGPTRRAWPAPTRMLPPLAANAHAHAWKRATQYGDRQTRRPGARSAQGWSRRRPAHESWGVRRPCARPPPFKAATSRDRAAWECSRRARAGRCL